MPTDLPNEIVDDFQRGALSRRQLVARLMGLGAAMAVGRTAVPGEGQSSATFQASGLDHVALNVADVARSREFYLKHLGLKVLRDGGDDSCFLGREDGFFLALFRRTPAGLNHYCYRIRHYDPDQAARKLEAAGLDLHREDGRIYFDDPDGIEVQITG